jgi:hypothetical protein
MWRVPVCAAFALAFVAGAMAPQHLRALSCGALLEKDDIGQVYLRRLRVQRATCAWKRWLSPILARDCVDLLAGGWPEKSVGRRHFFTLLGYKKQGVLAEMANAAGQHDCPVATAKCGQMQGRTPVLRCESVAWSRGRQQGNLLRPYNLA